MDRQNNDHAGIVRLFEMLLSGNDDTGSDNNYHPDEGVFWQHSLWAQKLASVLLWANHVKCKITGDTDDSLSNKLPDQLNALAIRPAILVGWIQARRLCQELIKKLELKRTTSTGNSITISPKDLLTSCLLNRFKINFTLSTSSASIK